MRIIHCADLHLDSKMKTHLTKEQARERNGEILRTFGKMVDYAAKNGVSVILMAGDTFDTRNVSVNVRNAVRDIIERNANIDFLYLKGNHDTDSFLANLEEIPQNLCLFHDRWRTYTYNNVAITGVELDGSNAYSIYNTLVLDHDKFNIVMLHGQTAEYKSKEKAEVISLGELRDKYIDYLALGHVHSFHMDRLDGRGVWCYSGCLEGRGFDECGDKGFVVLDIDTANRTATYEFVSVAARTLHTLEVDVTGIENTQDAANRIEAAIAKAGYSSTSLVKFALCGEIDVECDLNVEFLAEQFAEYFYAVRVKDETKIHVNYQDYENDISLKGEFIRMVSASDYTPEEKSQIIRAGLQALQGEEIVL